MPENNHYISRLAHLRLPRVCVAVFGSDPGQMIEKAESIVRDNTFIEFRLDYISRPALALSRIKEFTDFHPHIAVIATCRRASSGGKFQGSIAAQLEILGKAAAAGCQLVDVELQTAIRLKPAQLEKLRSKAAIVLSYHDFKATQKLEETL
ncbi:MAG TPA: type I 3-dehydroquinate dehydratase, partial [Candidatus Acidoferrales bacterium]|nr:type I 3-dehydroquinate dehydratase [Candidatus Acidoferrales bacterium]